MNQLIALRALHWLEDVLLPQALTAAGLPVETKLEELRKLKLPQPPEVNRDAMASDCCQELLLSGAVVIASTLAQSERAQQICQVLMGLMWRDALDYSQSRDLALATNIEGIDNSDYEAAFEAAQRRWQNWQATDQVVKQELENFVWLCGESVF